MPLSSPHGSCGNQEGWGRMLGWGGWSQGHFVSSQGPVQSFPRFRRSWSSLAPGLCPYQVIWSQLLLMPAVEMTLLLLFFGGVWAQMVDTGILDMTTPRQSSFSLVPNISEDPNLNSVTSNHTIIRIPEKDDSTGHQISPPSSNPYTDNQASFPETATTASGGLSISEPTTYQEVSTRKSSMLQEISNPTSNPAAPAMNNIPELHTRAGGTIAASSQETSSATSELPVITVTSSQETSSATSELPVITVTSSQDTSSATNELPVITVTSSLETSSGTSGPPVTMTASSLETSSGTSGHPITTVTSSLETPKGTSGSSISGVKISVMPTPEASPNTGSGLSPNSGQKTHNTLLVTVLVALLVLSILLLLLMMWRQRQKRRTGALTLNRGGKRNGVVDAWAGPARVADEEAGVVAAVPAGNKGSGVPEAEGSGRQPALTTFFGRRQSRQGSVALEELKAGSSPSLREEEEPLVAGEDGAPQAPAAPTAGDAEAP